MNEDPGVGHHIGVLADFWKGECANFRGRGGGAGVAILTLSQRNETVRERRGITLLLIAQEKYQCL